jgi:hypothetical protein
MKKIIFLSSFICLFLIVPVKNYAQHFENGDNILSPGIGFGSALGGRYGYSYSSQTPGISLQYEHGNWDVGGPGVISLGAYLGFKSYSYEEAYPYFSYSYKWNYTIIGIRSAYHFNMINAKDLDVYGGLMLSYSILSFKYSSSDPTYDYLYRKSYGSTFDFSLYIGGRYYFTDNVAAFLELGYGISNVTLGASFRL